MAEWTGPLPCIVCGNQPKPAFRDTKEERCMQPLDALMFNAGSGHYGSTVWDTMSSGRSLEISVCDECLVNHKDRVAVVVRRPPVRQPVEYTTWNPDVPS